MFGLLFYQLQRIFVNFVGLVYEILFQRTLVFVVVVFAVVQGRYGLNLLLSEIFVNQVVVLRGTMDKSCTHWDIAAGEVIGIYPTAEPISALKDEMGHDLV